MVLRTGQLQDGEVRRFNHISARQAGTEVTRSLLGGEGIGRCCILPPHRHGRAECRKSGESKDEGADIHTKTDGGLSPLELGKLTSKNAALTEYISSLQPLDSNHKLSNHNGLCDC